MPDRGVTVIDAIGESGKWKAESGIAAGACRAPCRQNTCVIRKNSTSSPTGTPSSQAIRYLPMS
ncbi:hypothetical protein C7S13_4001 [Burkholderia cepacia]|nr:hypothetical protein [Burkholderia cepacia]